MSAGQGEDTAERFAAAIERGAPPRDDDVLAREWEIVALLRSAGPAFAPTSEESARMKQRLIAALTATGAGAPVTDETANEQTVPIERITVEPKDDPLDTPGELTGTASHTSITTQRGLTRRRTIRHRKSSRPAARARRDGRPARRGLVRRATVVSSVALIALVAVFGAGTFASRDALPGDTLYGVKRAAESIGLALTFDEEAKARRHLELAATRLAEVEQLLQRHRNSGAVSADPHLVSAIHDFDEATLEGSRLLLDDDTTEAAADAAAVQRWAAEQAQRLEALRENVPPPLLARAEALLARLLGRTGTAPSSPVCTPEGSVADRAAGDEAPTDLAADGPIHCEPVLQQLDQLPADEAGSVEDPTARHDVTAPTAPEPTDAVEPDTTSLPTPTPPAGGTGPSSSTSPNSGEGSNSEAPTTTTPPQEPGGDEPRGLFPLLPIKLPPLLPGLPSLQLFG